MMTKSELMAVLAGVADDTIVVVQFDGSQETSSKVTATTEDRMQCSHCQRIHFVVVDDGLNNGCFCEESWNDDGASLKPVLAVVIAANN